MRYAALTLVLLAVALFVGVRRGGPVMSPLEVGWTADGFRLAFTREPPGPGAVRLSAASGERTLVTSSADGVHHAVDLRGLVPGQPLVATPMAGQRAGAPVVLTSRGSALLDLEEKDGPDGAVIVTFRTAAAARCKLLVLAASGLVWLPGEPSAAIEHALTIPPAHAPFLGASAVEITAGDDTHVEPVVATARARTARRLRLADELAPQANRTLLAVKLAYLARVKGGDAGPAPVLPALPGWLAEELGGVGGALDDPDLPPRRKDQLYRTLVYLADADRENPPARRAGWHLLPHARDFGVSSTSRYAKATRMPLLDTGRNQNAPMTIFNDYSIKLATADELAGNPKVLRDLSGRFELDRLTPDTRVELHTRARVPARRALEALINDVYLVRLNAPAEADGNLRDLYAAFDPAYLVTGWNTVRVYDYVGADDPDPTAKCTLEPPGLEVLIAP